MSSDVKYLCCSGPRSYLGNDADWSIGGHQQTSKNSIGSEGAKVGNIDAPIKNQLREVLRSPHSPVWSATDEREEDELTT